MVNKKVGLLFLAALAISCKQQKPTKSIVLDPKSETFEIEKDILTNKNSFYYIDVNNYFKNEDVKELAIGVFDSGTGGLTVLDALVNYDNNNNKTLKEGEDGEPDFNKENFIYLGDQANMPYGNYFSANKTSLLKEHIIKDIQFLIGQNYYTVATDKSFKTDKQKIKAIVIACNTATAYGQRDADEFIAKTGLNIPVIGVINAGTRGTLQQIQKNEDASVGVFATVGTIASNGYGNAILKMHQELGYTGKIQIFNQGGHGVAEAVDEEPDFINKNLKAPRKDYRGPSLDNESYKIDKALMDIYNFNFDHGKMLCNSKNIEDCNVLQINDSENYIRYHLVSLLEQIRKAENPLPLKALILGCTHYPYLKKEIKMVLTELYNYRDKNQNYTYRNLMSSDVKIINPAEYVAKELYDALRKTKNLNTSGNYLTNSEFYISVPNKDNQNVVTDKEGRFTYDYKYGRNAGEIQEYVKVVPFNKTNISNETINRFKSSIPATFTMISYFNNSNKKMKSLANDYKIK